MNQCCLVCNNRVGVSPRLATNVFKEYTSIGKSLSTLLSEILQKPICEESVPYSNVICKHCHKTVTEYDLIKLRLQVIQSDLRSQFKCTLPKHNLDYNTIAKEPTASSPSKTSHGNTERKVGARVVLPASKLQPLPPDYVINVGKLGSALKSTGASTLNLKVTVGSSVLTQSIKTTKAQSSPTKTLDKVTETNINNALASILNSRTVSIDTNDSPKDLQSSSVVMKTEHDDENNDEQPMEIDQDCTLMRITHENDFGENKTQSSRDKIMFTAPEDGDGDREDEDEEDGGDEGDELVLQVLPAGEDAESGERQTIVMSRENGTVLRMASGQRLVYEAGQIALLPADGDGSGDDDADDDDAHDSNDESQIELQVSGDEETANAIIAAAQEQGGAFIKVESGEMFRVKSVQSKKEITHNEVRDITTPLVKYEDNTFKCLVCEQYGDPLSTTKPEGGAVAMMEHMRVEHEARVYLCHVCNRVLRKRTELTAHLEEHSATVGKLVSSAADKRKVHSCTVCKNRYNSRTLLTEHMNIHNGTRPHACAACGKTFASKYTYQAHLKTHLERPRPFKCSQCPKSFLTQQNLNQHEKTHSGVKDFICKICNKAFGTQHNLEVHGVVHSKNKPYICGVCGKGFARRAEVKDHMRTHTGERPFACEVCGATFAQRSNLHSHRRATHMDDKRYQCDDCPKRFKRRRLLEYHIKALHTGERPLQCEVCRATFVYPEHYKKHMRIHSGERPYVCEVCGKSFNSRDNRNTHRFVHSDKKPYECLVCGAGYMRKQLLYAHMNTSGHLAESIVVNQPRVQKVNKKIITPAKTGMVDHVLHMRNENTLDVIFEDPELDLDTTETKSILPKSELEPKLYITTDKKLILQDGKSTINLIQDSEDPTLLTLHNSDASVKCDSDVSELLGAVTVDPLGEQAQMVATTESGGVVRLVQIQLENGTSGWVALN